MMKFWNVVQFMSVAAGGWVRRFLGGYDGLLFALVVFVAANCITHVMCSIVDNHLSSEIGIRGIFKKMLIFILVGIGNILDVNVIGSGAVLRTAVIYFYLSSEGVSLIENAAHIDLTVPKKLKEFLELFHNRGGRENIK